MPSRKGWIFTGVLRIGKSRFRSNKSYGQTWRGWVKGNLRNTRTNLCGSCPFSRAVIGMLESKGGCELPRGSTWVTVGESVNRWHRRLGKYHGFLHSISTCEASGRIPGNTHPPISMDGKCWDLTAYLGQTPVGFQIQSQVVEHTWHESEKSTSHMPLQKECSAGACCKNFLGQCRYL